MQNDSVNFCVAFVPFISSSFGKTNAKTKKKGCLQKKKIMIIKILPSIMDFIILISPQVQVIGILDV